MSGKTFYRVWQTINWLWSENWNINNIHLAAGSLEGSRLLFAQFRSERREREREREKEWVLLVNDVDIRPGGSFNSTLWSWRYCQHLYTQHNHNNYFFNYQFWKLRLLRSNWWRTTNILKCKLSSHHYWTTMSRFHQIQPLEKLKYTPGKCSQM